MKTLLWRIGSTMDQSCCATTSSMQPHQTNQTRIGVQKFTLASRHQLVIINSWQWWRSTLANPWLHFRPDTMLLWLAWWKRTRVLRCCAGEWWACNVKSYINVENVRHRYVPTKSLVLIYVWMVSESYRPFGLIVAEITWNLLGSVYA